MSSRPTGNVVYDNSGRVVLVTGGCNGIGLSICRLFAETGATVVSLDVDAAAASELPEGVHFRQCDVSRPEECRTATEWVVQELDAIDVLVNNAAIQPPDSYKTMDQLDVADWQRMVDINFSGYAMMAKYTLNTMLAQKSGTIVNIASAQGHRTARRVPAYGPIKSANLMQARQWGVEYAREGIRVVSVSPGAIETPLMRDSLKSLGGGDELANRHPLGRIGEPLEIARAVVWLASPHASFVTATDLAVDGGLGAFAAFADPY